MPEYYVPDENCSDDERLLDEQIAAVYADSPFYIREAFATADRMAEGRQKADIAWDEADAEDPKAPELKRYFLQSKAKSLERDYLDAEKAHKSNLRRARIQDRLRKLTGLRASVIVFLGNTLMPVRSDDDAAAETLPAAVDDSRLAWGEGPDILS